MTVLSMKYEIHYCFHVEKQYYAGADPGFQVRGDALKKIAPRGAKIFEVFRVKNHDFTPKKSYFFQF